MEWCDVFCDLLQYTCTEKCNLFVLYNKNSNGLLKDLGGMKKEKQVCWRDLTWIWCLLCVFPLIHHQVTLLYKLLHWIFSTFLQLSSDQYAIRIGEGQRQCEALIFSFGLEFGQIHKTVDDEVFCFFQFHTVVFLRTIFFFTFTIPCYPFFPFPLFPVSLLSHP